MAKLIIIAAIGKNGELGKDNHLIWPLKGDLKFFKAQTLGHKIVMGYNTYKSLPGILPKREEIVLTHKNLQVEGITVFNDFQELTDYLHSLDEEVFIIGGATIYKLFIDSADTLLLTEISKEEPMADTYFPSFNKNDFTQEILSENEENNISYRHVRYRRK